MKTAPNPIDKHVGAKLRLYRQLAGVSQEKLGAALGVSFQQVQKYENGVNRISASRLQQIAAALNAPLSSFFEDAMAPKNTSPTQVDQQNMFAAEFLSTADGIRFLRAISKLRDPKACKSIVDLVVALAESGGQDTTGHNSICSAA